MKFKNIKYFKSFLSNLDFDFNTLTDILNTTELHEYIKAEPPDTINFKKIFDHIYQVKNIDRTTYLKPIYNLIVDKTKDNFVAGDFDLFISFKAVKGGAHFDKEVNLDGQDIKPMVTWGTSPQDVLTIDENIPNPENEKDADKKNSIERSLK